MSQSKFARWAAAVALLVSASVYRTVAQQQQQGAPPVSSAVYWASAEPEAEVYLVGNEGGGDLRLTVISKQELKVVYRTSINSVEPVEKELAPVSVAPGGVRRYQFTHHFSKMTIWMALEFKQDGKPVPGLTRTFYNSIFEVVPNGHFDFVPRPKP